MPVPVQKFREAIFQLLYSYDLGKATDENMVELISQELAITKKTVKEAQDRMHKVRRHLKDIDAKIEKASISYAFERIPSVERNVLRLGVYELLFDDAIPPKVAITEAMRLARKFSTKEAANFINAILNAIYKESTGEAIDAKAVEDTTKDLNEIEKVSHEASQNQPLEDESNE